MTVDFREWKQRQAEAAKVAAKRRAPDLRVAQRAELDARAVTAVPEWDTFLTYLQAALETSRKQRSELKEQLLGDALINHDAIMKAKLTFARIEERVVLLEAVIDLPKDLIQNGERATALLGKLDGDGREDAKAG